MKKKSIKITAILLMFIFTLCVTSCDNKTHSAKGYGIVHDNYVGIATVTTKRARVRELAFEEVFLPTDWAIIKDESVDEELYVTYTSKRGKEVKVAKYIVIDGKKFTGKSTEDKKTVLYSAPGIEEIKQYVATSEENAKWYAEALLAKDAYIATKTFDKLEVSYEGQKGFTKTEAGYWPQETGGLGWKKNMDALTDAFLGTKMNFDEAKFVRNESDGIWKFGKVQSTATLVDALDYYKVAKKAYDHTLEKE